MVPRPGRAQKICEWKDTGSYGIPQFSDLKQPKSFVVSTRVVDATSEIDGGQPAQPSRSVPSPACCGGALWLLGAWRQPPTQLTLPYVGGDPEAWTGEGVCQGHALVGERPRPEPGCPESSLVLFLELSSTTPKGLAAFLCEPTMFSAPYAPKGCYEDNMGNMKRA